MRSREIYSHPYFEQIKNSSEKGVIKLSNWTGTYPVTNSLYLNNRIILHEWVNKLDNIAFEISWYDEANKVKYLSKFSEENVINAVILEHGKLEILDDHKDTHFIVLMVPISFS